MGLKNDRHDLKQMRVFFREREERAYFMGLILGGVAGFGGAATLWVLVSVLF